MAPSRFFDMLRLDVRLAIRLLWKQRGFTAVAVLTLALSIGATTGAFALVEATLIRGLPYPEPDRLIAITANRPDGTLKGLNVSYTKLQRIQEQSRTLAAAGGVFALSSSFVAGGVPQDVPAAIASKSLFDVLAVSPALGRGFLPEEDRAGGASVALISDGFWKSRFGADPSTVGRSVRFDGKNVTVVGVLPPAFQFPFQVPEPQVWFPRVFENPVFGPDRVQSGASFLTVVARTQPGVSMSEVQRELTALSTTYGHDAPGAADATLILETDSLKNSLVGQVRVSLFALLAAVGLVLLIGCSNIASLLMARATTREPEIALRRALGASRGRLVRQLLTESLLLSCAGGTFGVLLAALIVDAVPRLPAGLLPRMTGVHLDAGVLLFSLVISMLAGLMFGLVPSMRASASDLQGSPKLGGRGAAGSRRGGRARAVLVVAQVALAVVLVVSAGLLVKSFAKLVRVDSGFAPEHVMTFHLALPAARYPKPAQQAEFFRQLVDRVQTLPTVKSAGASSFLPLGGVRFVYVCAGGAVCLGVGRDPVVALRQITPAYLDTMGIALVRGRGFSDHDDAGTTPVAILTETAAAQLFPGQDPVGKHLFQSRGNILTNIVGVARDLRSRGPGNPPLAEMFMPQVQSPFRSMSLVVRSASDPTPLVAAVRQTVGAMDPDIPLADVSSMSALLSDAVAQPRLTAQVIGAFGLLAMLVAALGIHGLLAFAVTQRTHEIGIRVALGATSRDLVRLVVSQSLRLVAAGTLLGFAVSFQATKLLASLLVGTSARDPVTFIGVAVAIGLAAFAATFFPARQASRVDPIVALRQG